MNAKEPRIIVCVPAYNEEKNIGALIIRILTFVDDVIVCDDGSADLTADIADKLGAIVVKHMKNRGYGASLQTLFKKALELNADIVVTIDGDGQHNPEEIPLLINAIINPTLIWV